MRSIGEYTIQSQLEGSPLLEEARQRKISNKARKAKLTLGLTAVAIGGTAATNTVINAIQNAQEEKQLHPESEVSTESFTKRELALNKALPTTLKVQSAFTAKVSEVTKTKPFVLTSSALKGVEVNQKEQLSLLTSANMTYVIGSVPNEVLFHGKTQVDQKVRAFLMPKLQKYTKKYDIEGTEEFLLAASVQEHGNNLSILKTDPMQMEQYTNEKITNPEKSVELSVERLATMLKANEGGDARYTIQAYNMGEGLLEAVKGKEFNLGSIMEYSKKKAQDMKLDTDTWKKAYAYGDYTYVAKVLPNFQPTEKWSEKIDKAVQEQAKLSTKTAEHLKQQAAALVQETLQATTTTVPANNLTVQNMVKSDRLKGKIIMVDPGHGGNDGGAASNGVKESVVAYNIALYLKAKLEAQGATVIMSRGENYVQINDRVNRAVKEKADLILSIHLNSASPTAKGVETWHAKKATAGTRGYQFAHFIQENAVKVFNGDNRGIESSANNRHGRLGVLDNSNIPSALVEVGFVSNANERALLQQSHIVESYGNALALGIMQYFQSFGDISKDPIEMEKPAPTQTKAAPVKEEKQEHSLAQDEKDIKVAVSNRTTGKVDTVSLEDYLIGVIATEMPTKYDIEALKAQAIASRTKICKELLEQQKGSKKYVSSHGSIVNVDDTVMLQVYRNKAVIEKELDKDTYNKVVKAVHDTAGTVLTYDSNLIDSVFFASTNGKTESAKEVWGSDIPYLKAVDSHWDTKTNEYKDTKVLSVSQVEKALGVKIDQKENGKVEKRSDGNRVDTYTIGGKTFSGVEMRTKLGLKSTDFTFKQKGNSFVIETKGYGHGVGMSQVGAGNMAAEGMKYKDILTHYYQKASLSTYKDWSNTLKKNQEILENKNN